MKSQCIGFVRRWVLPVVRRCRKGCLFRDKIDPIFQVAYMSSDIVTHYREKYDLDIVLASALITKYLIISILPKEDKKRIMEVSIPPLCPLCMEYANKECKGCVLSKEGERGCGMLYETLRNTARDGTFTETAFIAQKVVRQILDKRFPKQ